MTASEPPRLYSEKEVAKLFGYTTTAAIAQLRAKGAIAHIRIGNLIRYTDSQITEYLQRCEYKAKPWAWQRWPGIKPLLLPEILELEAEPTDSNGCGIYFLIAYGIIVYIGQSQNVRGRLANHRSRAREAAQAREAGALSFTETRWLSVPWPYHLAAEAVYIKHFAPHFNYRGAAFMSVEALE